MILRALLPTLIFTVPAQAQQQRPTATDPAFQKFVAKLWKDAQAKGITKQTFNLAFAGVTPDPRVIALTTRQLEQVKPMGAYVASLASGQRAARGEFARKPNGEACSTPRRSASAQARVKRGLRPSHRPLARRPHDKNPCDRRCSGQSASFDRSKFLRAAAQT